MAYNAGEGKMQRNTMQVREKRSQLRLAASDHLVDVND
jgi:hypothetical protein